MLRRLLLGTTIAALCSVALQKMQSVELRQPAPDFTLVDSNGSSLRLSDYKGQLVLLDFWATWCHGCKTEIPWYMSFVSKYKDQGLAAIGVAMDDDGWKKVKPFVTANKMNYPVVLGNDSLAKRYGINALPVTLLIDREGRIAASHTGLVDKTVFEEQIQSLLHGNHRN